MEEEWQRQKEKEKAREKEIVVCEEKAAEEQKEIRRLEIIESGKVKDYQRLLQNARKEVLQEKTLVSERKKSEQACWNVKWTRKLAEEVARLKNEEIKERKRRQLLRSTSVELRQLEEQLRSAYAAKALQIQLKEQEAIWRNTRCKELQQDKMIKGWFSNNNSEQENFVKNREKKARYRKDLQDQLIINYRKCQQKSEEEQRERKMMEEISQFLRIEEMEKSRQKKAMATKLRAEEEAFLKAKEIWMCKEKKALLDEHNRIERILAEKENEKRRNADTKAENLSAKERMTEKMARRMLDGEMKKREREDIINRVYEDEEKSSMQAKLRNESLEKQRLARDLLEDMERQKKAIAERKVQNAAVDNAFGQYIEEQNQIAINQEQEKRQARRRLGIRYGEDLKAAIMNKKILCEEEMLRKQATMCNDKEAEAIRRQQISQERLRMLQEHAPRLEGFLKVGGISIENFENCLSEAVLCQEECSQFIQA